MTMTIVVALGGLIIGLLAQAVIAPDRTAEVPAMWRPQWFGGATPQSHPFGRSR